MNLLANSPLLNILSSLFCFFMSFISCLYSFSNSSIVSLAFPKFSLPSQVSDFTINSFYHTRYLSFPLIFCLFNILSTSHSSSPSIITGAGCSFSVPLLVLHSCHDLAKWLSQYLYFFSFRLLLRWSMGNII